MVAVNDHPQRGVGASLGPGAGKVAERNPFIAVDLANRQLLGLAAIDESWPLRMREMDPRRDRCGADLQGGRSVWDE